MPDRILEDWKPGDDLLASRLQALQDRALAGPPISVGPGLLLYTSPGGGLAIALENPRPIAPAEAKRFTVTDPNGVSPGEQLTPGSGRLVHAEAAGAAGTVVVVYTKRETLGAGATVYAVRPVNGTAYSAAVGAGEAAEVAPVRWVDVWDGPEVTGFTARVTSSTRATGTPQPWRWEYQIAEVVKTAAGYGGWNDKTGGVTGTAFNRIEDQNADSGVIGSGTDTADLEGTIEPQPVPYGTRVQIDVVPLTDAAGVPQLDGSGNRVTEYWFSYETGLTGDCEETA